MPYTGLFEVQNVHAKQEKPASARCTSQCKMHLAFRSFG